MAQALNRHAIVILALKLVQPARLADVTEGVKRLLPETPDYAKLKEGVKDEIDALIQARLIKSYHGQRYVLSPRGETYFSASGIAYQIEARRMYLLKETRRASLGRRSGTRNGSLEQ